MTTPLPPDGARAATADPSTGPDVPPVSSGARTYPSLRAAWIPLAALCLAFFVEMVDNTLLTIALPTIGRDLQGSTTSLQWITGAYSLTFGGLLLTAGSIADRFGRRRVLLIGLIRPKAVSPISRTRRRPKRSAIDPAVTRSPPNVRE